MRMCWENMADACFSTVSRQVRNVVIPSLTELSRRIIGCNFLFDTTGFFVLRQGEIFSQVLDKLFGMFFARRAD